MSTKAKSVLKIGATALLMAVAGSAGTWAWNSAMEMNEWVERIDKTSWQQKDRLDGELEEHRILEMRVQELVERVIHLEKADSFADHQRRLKALEPTVALCEKVVTRFLGEQTKKAVEGDND